MTISSSRVELTASVGLGYTTPADRQMTQLAIGEQ
jgi:hypothetical protein